VRGRRGRALQRLRSERLERSFAHVCGSGNQRRTWLRGIENVQKRYLITTAGRNLGLLMLHLFGVGTPRSFQGLRAAALTVVSLLGSLSRWLSNAPFRLAAAIIESISPAALLLSVNWRHAERAPSSTGC
jgi:hypothetical protein